VGLGAWVAMRKYWPAVGSNSHFDFLNG
jgi:hypothetical protein